jgi:hypothetical protein
MSGFLSDFVDRITKSAPWGEVNPLVIIGLTEAVLETGVTPDGIYRAIRAYSRQLAADVSPDRNPNVSKERLSQIMAAFNYLDDRDNFDRALADFKNIRAEDRREVRILSKTVRVLRSQISDFESNLQTLGDARRELDSNRREFERQKNKEELLVPKLKAGMAVIKKDNDYLRDSVSRLQRTSSEWKRNSEQFCHYISGLDGFVTNEDEVFAFEAKWIAVASLYWNVDFPDLSPLNTKRQVRIDFRQAALLLGLTRKDVLCILQAWQNAVDKFDTPGKLETRKLPLAFSLIRLTAGKPYLIFGSPSGILGGRVIGSIPASGNFSISRSNLRYTLNRESVLESMQPGLVNNGLMVSISTERSKRIYWSNTCPLFRFDTKKVILAVG